MRLYFRRRNDDSLFEQINAYLKRVRAREERALEAEYRLKQCLQILSRKQIAQSEGVIIGHAYDYLREQEHERANAVQA